MDANVEIKDVLDIIFETIVLAEDGIFKNYFKMIADLVKILESTPAAIAEIKSFKTEMEDLEKSPAYRESLLSYIQEKLPDVMSSRVEEILMASLRIVNDLVQTIEDAVALKNIVVNAKGEVNAK